MAENIRCFENIRQISSNKVIIHEYPDRLIYPIPNSHTKFSILWDEITRQHFELALPATFSTITRTPHLVGGPTDF
jgi:hypothetical protein